MGEAFGNDHLPRDTAGSEELITNVITSLVSGDICGVTTPSGILV
jgi:hypothetical protein